MAARLPAFLQPQSQTPGVACANDIAQQTEGFETVFDVRTIARAAVSQLHAFPCFGDESRSRTLTCSSEHPACEMFAMIAVGRHARCFCVLQQVFQQSFSSVQSIGLQPVGVVGLSAFVVMTSFPDQVPASYSRYLVNGLREDFDMPGTPIRLTFRGQGDKNPYRNKKKSTPSRLRKHLGKPAFKD